VCQNQAKAFRQRRYTFVCNKKPVTWIKPASLACHLKNICKLPDRAEIRVYAFLETGTTLFLLAFK
jgi:hypothetical protein